MQCEVIPLELVDGRYYHLDTCSSWPGHGDLLSPGVRRLRPRGAPGEHRRLDPSKRAESEHFACNAVVLGKTVITNTGCPALHQQLHARGFETAECPLSEFVKAGGSASV